MINGVIALKKVKKEKKTDIARVQGFSFLFSSVLIDRHSWDAKGVGYP